MSRSWTRNVLGRRQPRVWEELTALHFAISEHLKEDGPSSPGGLGRAQVTGHVGFANTTLTSIILHEGAGFYEATLVLPGVSGPLCLFLYNRQLLCASGVYSSTVCTARCLGRRKARQ